MLCDAHGSVLASLSRQLSLVYSPLEIEVKAVSSALQFAADLGFSQVVLESDSQVLMTALVNDCICFFSSDGLLIDDVRLGARFCTQFR